MQKLFWVSVLGLIFSCCLSFKCLAQQIVFGAVDQGSYGPGSDISVPIVLKSSFKKGCRFELYLSDNNGNFNYSANPIGVCDSHFATFINGVIPASTVAGSQYKVSVRIVNAPGETYTIPCNQLITIGNVAGPSVKVAPTDNTKVLMTDKIWGYCTLIKDGNQIAIKNSTSGAAVTGELVNDYDSSQPVVDFDFNETPFYTLNLNISYYTIRFRAVANGVVSTKSYVVLNSTYNLSLQSSGSQTACIHAAGNGANGYEGSDQISYSVNTGLPSSENKGSLLTNYPGLVYRFDWGDNQTEYMTQGQLVDSLGVVKHKYAETSCGRAPIPLKNPVYNSYQANIFIEAPFCTGASAPITTYPKVFRSPSADFDIPGDRGCINKTIVFHNKTIPGQSEDETGTSCTDATSYLWYVKKSTDPESAWTLYSDEFDFPHSFKTPGTYNIKLVASNKSCPPSEITHDICIENSPQLDYDFTQSAPCAPVNLTVTNKTPTGSLCKITYLWQVLDSLTASVVTDGVNFLPSNDVASPQITITRPGSYLLRLTTFSSCDTLTLDKPVLVAGPLTVSLPDGQKICRGIPISIDVSSDESLKPVYNGYGKNKTYKWTITGGGYSFEKGSENSAYPTIKFTDPNEYHVTVTFANECCTMNDTEILTFYGPVYVFAGNDGYVCDNVPSVANTTYKLHGNQPQNFETGQWSVLSGPSGGHFDDATKFDAVISGLVPGTYKLRWSISNPGGCIQHSDMTLIVYPLPNGGSISGSQRVCTGSGGTLNVNGVTGKILQWESSSDQNTWTAIANTSSSLSFSNLQQKTYFRVKVGSDGADHGCSTEVYSPAYSVDIDPLSVGGVASGAQTYCSFSPAGQITLSGYTGDIKRWEQSTNGGASWIPIPSLANSYTYNNLTSTTQFRAVVQSGSCSIAYSSPVTIEILKTPTVANAGPNKVFCLNGSGYQLQGNQPLAGTGVWTQTAGPAVTFDDPAKSNATVSGLQKGQHYQFTWTISNGICTPSKSDVFVDVLSDITNSIKTDRPVSCKNDAVNLVTDHLNGGDVPSYLSAQYTYQWERSANGVDGWTSIAGGIAENITVYPSVTTWYRRTVKSRGSCQAISDPLKITINATTPDANAGNDQILCNVNSFQLSGNDPGYGFTGTWKDLTQGSSLTFFPDAHSPNAEVRGLEAGKNYNLEWSIAGISPCPDQTSDVKITVRNPVTPAVAGDDIHICLDKDNSNNHITLTGNTPDQTNGETGVWRQVSGPGIATISDPSKANTGVSGLADGTYVFEWKISTDATIADAACKESSDQVIVKVKAYPVAGNIDGGNVSICKGSIPGELRLNGYSVADQVQWQVSADNTLFSDIAGATDARYAPGVMTSTSWYRVKVTQADGCGVSVYTSPVKIQVDEPSQGGIVTSNVSRLCTGTNNGSLTLSGYTGNIVRWEVSTGNNTNWMPVASVSNPYNFHDLAYDTWFRAVVRNGVCSESVSSAVKIEVLPNVTTANAGADRYLCNETEFFLDGNAALNGTGIWSQVSGPGSHIEDPANPKSRVTSLVPGTYMFRWTISNGICDPSTDDIIIYNYQTLTNHISGTTTICSGQTVHITGDTPSGGNGSYNYRWEVSADNNNWTVVAGQNQDDYTVVVTSSEYIRRIVESGPCSMISNAVLITAQPPLSNNIISGNQELCIGDAAGKITGSMPSGGDGSYFYHWQKSSDQTNWLDITGANTADYNPGVLSETTFFRRIVSTLLCDGEQRDEGNIVKIIIHPLAKAEFNAAVLKSCAPFDLKQVITTVPYDDRNSSYEWYADGNSIGTGVVFPGYTIPGDGESVKITLITKSKFGCSSDTLSRSFSTVKDVIASFTKDQSRGCGPLAVTFTNTSAPLNGGTYFWDFGNGQTSVAEQPGTITFEPHPLHRDTTYVIKLRASTGCKDTEFEDSVLVRPLPKATFSPDKTIGCSPLEIAFTNQSAGIPNTYTFDFGDGTTVIKNDNSPVSHTFYTTKTDTITVRLTAQNECGTDTSSYNIVIYPNTVTAQLVVNGDRKYGCAPFTVQFDNNSEGANRFYWDFKDGSKETTTMAPGSVTHTFTIPGTYEVNLQATNGCSWGTDAETITVYAVPDASINFADRRYCVKDPVEFHSVPDTSASYRWDFGDGTISNDANPTHIFTHSGKFNIRLLVLQSHKDGTVCSNLSSKEIEIEELPVALFTSNSTSLNCAPFKLIVSATPENAAHAEWDFGDPASSDNRSSGYISDHIYVSPGQYKVKEIAYNEAGCIDTIVKTIKIAERPKALFSMTDSVFCGTSATVNFSNQSEYGGADAVTYRWLVNGVQVSSRKNLTYAFIVPLNAPMPYQYKVELIAVSTMGCPDTVSHTIRFNPLPIAGFIPKVTIGCPPLKVEVQNTSVYGDQYFWYLDGKLVSQEETPSHVTLADANKTYTLKLVTVNQYGCRADSIEKKISTYPKPRALFTVNDSVSCKGTLDLKISNISEGATRYNWDFGDNTSFSSAAAPDHIYAQPGLYNLRLVAYNDFCSDTLTRIIRVAGPPQAVFTANITKACTQAEITFQNLSVNATSFLWDFGDGSYSGSKNPTHTFSYIKSPFSVKLTAIGEFGCADTVVQANYIQIVAPPKAGFTALPDSVIKIPDYTFTFKNTSTGNPVKYHWSFGDGKVSDEESPVHTFINTGSHEVQLTATNQEGCVDFISKTVRIDGVPGYLYVPSGFEPGSLKPDLKVFIPKGSGIAKYKIKIFNKWGQMVWESDKLDDSGSPAEGWDGTVGGRPVPQGVYFWDISATFIDGDEWKGMKYETGARRTVGPIHLIR